MQLSQRPWYHAAEYVEKQQAGYLPLDLSEMQREESEQELEEPA
jgi:hypothetical protein